MITTYEHPRFMDKLPWPDCDTIQLDPDWAWVTRQDGRIVALLLAGPAHGVVHVMMLRTEQSAGDAIARGCWLHGLLRQAMRECQARGFNGFMAFIEDSAQGRALRRLVRRPLQDYPINGSLVGGAF